MNQIMTKLVKKRPIPAPHFPLYVQKPQKVAMRGENTKVCLTVSMTNPLKKLLMLQNILLKIAYWLKLQARAP